MKKIICGMLAMTVMSLGISALAYTDIADSQYKDNIELLAEYGIISGNDDKFNPHDNLTRAEAAKLLIYSRNVNEEDLSPADEEDELQGTIAAVALEEPSFPYTDITPSHWGYQYILYATQTERLLSGFPDGTIRPDDPVTYAQFLTMAVHTVGYELYAEDMGGYPLGYYNAAKLLNITGGTDGIDLSAPITREEAAQIVYHAINVPLLAVDSYDFSLGVGVPKLKVLDGTDGTSRRTLLTAIQNNNRLLLPDAE